MLDDGVWTLLRGLFPKWEPTIEEATLFRKSFRSRKADMLKLAIEDYRTFYKYREPNLGEILKRYSDLVRAHQNSQKPDSEEPDTAAEEAELESSRRRIRHDIELMTGADISLVVSELAKMPSMSGFVGRIADDTETWNHTQRGIVWAKAEQMGLLAGGSSSTAPRSLSPGQG